MSELVTRINNLKAKILELEDLVMFERRRYADEIDHSDHLSYLITTAHNGKNCSGLCSYCTAVREHEARRKKDAEEAAANVKEDYDKW